MRRWDYHLLRSIASLQLRRYLIWRPIIHQKTSKTLKDLASIEVSPQKISDLIADEGKRLLNSDEGRRRTAFDEFAAFPEELAKKKLE